MLRTLTNVMGGTVRGIRNVYRNVMFTPTNAEEEHNNYQLACTLLRLTHVLWTLLYRPLKGFSISMKIMAVALINSLLFSGYLYYAVILFNGSRAFYIEEFLSMMLPVCMQFSILILHPLIYFYCADEFDRTMEYMITFKAKFNTLRLECKAGENAADRLDDSDSNTHTADAFQKLNVARVPIIVFIVGNLAIVSFVVSPALIYYLKGHNDLPGGHDYALLFPFYNHVESLTLYYVMTTISSIIVMCEAICGSPFMFYLLTFFSIVKYNAFIMHENMHTLSQNVTAEYEKNLFAKESGNEPTHFKNRPFSAFDRDLIRLLKVYQEFSKATKGIERVVNFYSSLLVPLGAAASFGIIAYLLMVPVNMAQGLRISFAIFFLLACHLNTCQIGKTFEDVGDINRYAVYNLPWFYLPPKTRKVVNCFQNSVFNHPGFKVLRIVSVDMSLFPQLWIQVYSYANILRKMSN